ncbi:MFS transporter [Vibrio sp. PP-XX7]
MAQAVLLSCLMHYWRHFTSADQRGKMQGLLSSVWGISAILGPLLGSLLASAFSWRAIFGSTSRWDWLRWLCYCAPRRPEKITAG